MNNNPPVAIMIRDFDFLIQPFSESGVDKYIEVVSKIINSDDLPDAIKEHALSKIAETASNKLKIGNYEQAEKLSNLIGKKCTSDNSEGVKLMSTLLSGNSIFGLGKGPGG